MIYIIRLFLTAWKNIECSSLKCVSGCWQWWFLAQCCGQMTSPEEPKRFLIFSAPSSSESEFSRNFICDFKFHQNFLYFWYFYYNNMHLNARFLYIMLQIFHYKVECHHWYHSYMVLQCISLASTCNINTGRTVLVYLRLKSWKGRVALQLLITAKSLEIFSNLWCV